MFLKQNCIAIFYLSFRKCQVLNFERLFIYSLSERPGLKPNEQNIFVWILMLFSWSFPAACTEFNKQKSSFPTKHHHVLRNLRVMFSGSHLSVTFTQVLSALIITLIFKKVVPTLLIFSICLLRTEVLSIARTSTVSSFSSWCLFTPTITSDPVCSGNTRNLEYICKLLRKDTIIIQQEIFEQYNAVLYFIYFKYLNKW